MNSKVTWYTADEILPEHIGLPIRQIYVWFVTIDDQIVIVGKGDKFQFPGGKPEAGETKIQTMKRELYEEAGLHIEKYNFKPKLFGYNLVEHDINPKWDGSSYLQLRYFMKVSQKASEIKLSVNERIEDVDQMEEAKFVDFWNLPQFIPWISGREEYKVVQGLI